jgi:hypothetical protein
MANYAGRGKGRIHRARSIWWVSATRAFAAILLLAGSLGVARAQVQIDPASGANLSWTDNSQNEASFRIERRTSAGTFALLANTPRLSGVGIVGTYKDTALDPATTYVYRVRAENSSGVSGWTNEVTISTTGSPPPTLTISSQPVSLTSVAGSAAYFAVGVVGTSLSYQWYRDGMALPGQTASMLYLSNVQSSDAGTYTVAITSPDGSATSNAATLNVVAAGSSRILNVSARAFLGGGGNQLVAGSALGGSGQKKLLVRGIGPGLASLGVAGFLPDPAVTVYVGSTKVATNDNWSSFPDQAALEAARVVAGAFALAPSSKDAALVANLNAGTAYTAETSSRHGSGLALFQLYDVDQSGSGSKITSQSARGYVGTGDQLLTGEFTLQGDVATVLLIRGVGPALKQFGVHGILNAPVLTLYRGSGAVGTPIASNSQWENNANLAALKDVTTRTGAFALAPGSSDAAVLVVLPPGRYTVQISGQNQTTGIAMIELYAVP